MQYRVALFVAAMAALVLVPGVGARVDGPLTEGADNIEVEARCSGTECTFEVEHVGKRPLYYVHIGLPDGVSVVDIDATGGGQCALQGEEGLCRWLTADRGPNFPMGETRLIDLETSTRLARGTQIDVCSSGHPNFDEYFCTAPEVLGAESDLELTLSAPSVHRWKDERGGRAIPYRVVVTNHGASASGGATLVLRISRPVQWTGSKYSGADKAGLPAGAKPIECRGKGVVHTCQVPALDRDEQAAVLYYLYPQRPGVYTARGTVTGTNPDPDLANNRASRSTTVRR